MDSKRSKLTASIYLDELVRLIEKRLQPDPGSPPEEHARLASFYAQSLLVAATFKEDERRLFEQLYQVREMVGPSGADIARQEYLGQNPRQDQVVIFDNVFSEDPLVQAQCQIMIHCIREGLARRVQKDTADHGILLEDLTNLVLGENH